MNDGALQKKIRTSKNLNSFNTIDNIFLLFNRKKQNRLVDNKTEIRSVTENNNLKKYLKSKINKL